MLHTIAKPWRPGNPAANRSVGDMAIPAMGVTQRGQVGVEGGGRAPTFARAHSRIPRPQGRSAQECNTGEQTGQGRGRKQEVALLLAGGKTKESEARLKVGLSETHTCSHSLGNTSWEFVNSCAIKYLPRSQVWRQRDGGNAFHPKISQRQSEALFIPCILLVHFKQPEPLLPSPCFQSS